jgi:hypothetical protein
MALETKHEGLLVRIPENLLPQGFDSESESFSLSFSGADLLILKRRRKLEKPGERNVVRLWGDLASFAVPDVLLLLFSNHSTGMLSFDLPDSHKSVYVKNGELVFAQSSMRDDRLGECLVRMGKITQGELEKASRKITAENKLGKILVDSGLISAKELFDGVRQQTVDIIYSLFHYPDGKFNFFETDLEQRNIVMLALETRELIVEGMLRELGVADLPLLNVYPVLNGRAVNLELNSEERQLHTMISEGSNVAEITDRLGMGELQALRLLFRFRRRGLIDIVHRDHHVGTSVQSGMNKLERTVSDFNSIFMDIYSILQVKVQGIDVLGRLNSFFDDMAPEIAEVFDQIRFLEDGSLPTESVLANLQQIERDDKVALAIKAFNELLYFTLFEMRNYLSHDDAERLMEIVQNMELF